VTYDSRWPAPPKPEVELTRNETPISDVPPGQERARFLQQLSERMGIEGADIDRPFGEITNPLGALECVSLAEAIWKVELGPRSGTVSEVGGLVTGFATLRALISAAEEAASGE